MGNNPKEAQQEAEKAEAKEVSAISRKITNALKVIQTKKGVNLKDLKKFLKDEKKMDVKESSVHIQMALKKKMDKGEIVKLDGGLYKLQGSKAQAKRPAGKDQGPARGSKRAASEAKPSAKSRKPAAEAKRLVKVPAKAAGKAAKIPAKDLRKAMKTRAARPEDQGADVGAAPEVGSAAASEALPQ